MTPVVSGRPVRLVATPDVGVPKRGVTSVGLVAKTAAPVPVSSVNAVARFADVNDPNDAALPTEVTIPVKLALVVTVPAVSPAAVPVMFVPTKADGVPSAGVTNVGELLRTTLVVPVLVVTPVPPFRTGNAVPDSPIASVPVVVMGEPEMLKNVGTVAATDVTVPVPVIVAQVGIPVPAEVRTCPDVPAAVNPYAVPVPYGTAPAVGVAVPFVPPFATGKVPVTPVVKGRPVPLVSTTADGVPNAGVTKVGDVLRTLLPDPVDVVTPVPPLSTGNAVPDRLIASVPEVVIGEPEMLRNVGTVAATLVTVPEPPPPEPLAAAVIRP